MKSARRILAGFRRDAPTERIFPGYFSFEEGLKPSWWRPALVRPEWGTILGVHENLPDQSSGAIVIGDLGLALLDASGDAAWVRYVDIVGWDQLSKEPISKSLRIHSRDGQTLDLPFELKPGCAFAFVQFLGNAINASRA